jgi:hypothetical protein
MLNPLNASKSPLSSRIALPVALMLAGIFGLGVATVPTTAILQQPSAPASPVPESHPSAEMAAPVLASASLDEELETTPKSSEDLISFCSKHVTEKRSFVVFKRGTCVVINEPCEDPKGEALRVLARCKQPDAKFLTEPTAEGDMIVTFKEPIFHRFNPEEVGKFLPWLKKSAAALLTPAESVQAGEGWVPPDQARFGLLARRRLLEDAADAVPVKIIRAKQRAIASN